MTNCNKPRCYWNGQLNSGECNCAIPEKMTDENYIQQLEEGRFNGIAKADAKYIAKRLELYTGQDRVFRLINKMVATSK